MKRFPLFLAALLLFSACNPTEGLYVSGPVGSKKKKKQKIQPSIAFYEAIKRYRKERGFFPQDMKQFEHYSDYTRTAMESMRELGFKDLTVSYLFLDSMVVDFAHVPIRKVKYKSTDLSIDLRGQLIYIKRDSSFYEYRVFQ